jgi:hypothetical protein
MLAIVHTYELVSLHRSRFYFYPNNIVKVVINKGETIGVADYLEGIEMLRKRAPEKKYLFFYELEEGATVTDELREVSSSPEKNQFTLAEAFIVKSLAHRLLANFYMRFNKPAKPAKVVASDKEALEWLSTFLN